MSSTVGGGADLRRVLHLLQWCKAVGRHLRLHHRVAPRTCERAVGVTSDDDVARPRRAPEFSRGFAALLQTFAGCQIRRLAFFSAQCRDVFHSEAQIRLSSALGILPASPLALCIVFVHLGHFAVDRLPATNTSCEFDLEVFCLDPQMRFHPCEIQMSRNTSRLVVFSLSNHQTDASCFQVGIRDCREEGRKSSFAKPAFCGGQRTLLVVVSHN